MNPDINGLWPAMLIPVHADGALDTVRTIANARRLLEAGCDGVTVFGTTGEPDGHQKVVIVSSGEGRVGLVVDQIIGNTQTVIKQLSKLHSGLDTFSGATILGDGAVALILDTAHLVSYGQAHEQQLAQQLGRAA